MSRSANATILALGALVLFAGIARAESPSPADSFSLQPRYLADAPAAPADTSIMGLLDKAGLAKPLNDLGITIGGFVEGSYTYNFAHVPGSINAGRVFDTKTEDPDLNQICIHVNKDVDMAKKEFQIGGRMEWMYGSDARFIHANGLFDDNNAAHGPNEQFDLTQLYVDLMFPVGNGLKVRVGKFVTLMGSETIDPNNNVFYSHSYLFGFAIPFTNTGIIATYNITSDLNVTAGITRGWDQALKDNNGDSIDFLGQVAWTVNKDLNVAFTLEIGPERMGNSGDYRYMFDLVVNYTGIKNWTLSLNADYGWEANAGNHGQDAAWFGTAFYAKYAINDYVALTGRVEWFEDPDGARGLGVTGSVFEVTLGADIKPFAKDKNLSSLRIRPEFRWDYSGDRFFDGGTKNNQFTAAVDVIFNF